MLAAVRASATLLRRAPTRLRVDVIRTKVKAKAASPVTSVKGKAAATLPKEGDIIVGANVYNDGQDPVIKADSEYPAWLWTLAEPPRSSRKLSPESEDYWKDARKKKNKANNVLREQGAI